jgi:hypothetical protein
MIAAAKPTASAPLGPAENDDAIFDEIEAGGRARKMVMA